VRYHGITGLPPWQNALTVFQSATKAAASRAQSIAAELHVDFGGIGVKTDINISVRNIEEKIVDTTSTPTMGLLLEWEAATMPRLFPLMKGEISVYRLTSSETIGFLRDLRTTFRHRWKNHERDHRPPHRGSVGASLR
jgi:hypothetical protein